MPTYLRVNFDKGHTVGIDEHVLKTSYQETVKPNLEYSSSANAAY